MGTAGEILMLVLLLAACGAGLILTVLQLPGTWLIVATAAVHGWYYHWSRITGTTMAILVGLAVLGEVGEAASSLVLARRGGASRRAGWYGLIGGLAGGLLLSIPIPLIGTLIGAALGCFAGAFVAELHEGRGLEAGARSGWYSAIGRAIGSLAKVAAGLMIAALAIFRAIWGFGG